MGRVSGKVLWKMIFLSFSGELLYNEKRNMQPEGGCK